MINKRILSPFQQFVKIESFSGILLVLVTLIALVWANSSYGEIYKSLWQYKVGFTSPHFELNKPLILWINDGLMAVFFFLIGLEIKREFLIGELNSIKKISFPLFGALGGMLAPVLLFLILNQNPQTLSGWGIPMATDIAFSLAILQLLGKRIPLSLKVFLTAFAIVDDLGAVLVIAVFYSSTISLGIIVIALILLGVLYALSYKRFYSKYLFFFTGVIVWILFLKSGIHPTLAGILLAFSIPVRQKIRTQDFIENLVSITRNLKSAKTSKNPLLTKEQIAEVDKLEYWIENYQSPLQYLEHKLHNWVAYFIIPVFALANAGVVINSGEALDTTLMRNIIIGLVLGKSIGITSIVLFAKRTKLIEIPKEIRIQHIVGVSFLAGIGFTMAIFIASLAFENSPQYVDSAKIGILIGSLISAIIGFVILRLKMKAEIEEVNNNKFANRL